MKNYMGVLPDSYSLVERQSPYTEKAIRPFTIDRVKILYSIKKGTPYTYMGIDDKTYVKVLSMVSGRSYYVAMDCLVKSVEKTLDKKFVK